MIENVTNSRVVGWGSWPTVAVWGSMRRRSRAKGGRAQSEQPLAPGGVGAVDVDGGVQAEAAGALPGEHVGYGMVVQVAAAQEEAEDAALWPLTITRSTRRRRIVCCVLNQRRGAWPSALTRVPERLGLVSRTRVRKTSSARAPIG
jgi:hypothetical protein